jgi:hypothetical protein
MILHCFPARFKVHRGLFQRRRPTALQPDRHGPGSLSGHGRWDHCRQLQLHRDTTARSDLQPGHLSPGTRESSTRRRFLDLGSSLCATGLFPGTLDLQPFGAQFPIVGLLANHRAAAAVTSYSGTAISGTRRRSAPWPTNGFASFFAAGRTANRMIKRSFFNLSAGEAQRSVQLLRRPPPPGKRRSPGLNKFSAIPS